MLGEEMTKPFDRIELLARAALQAHARHRAIESGAGLAPLVARATRHRDLLRAEVRSLIARDVLPAGVVDELTANHGYKNVSFDVLQLVAALRTSWEQVEHKTGLTLDDIDDAEKAADQLVTAVGAREQGARSASADVRLRAFTLMASTYDDVRRAITFLRWKDGDADRIAPTYFRSRPRRRPRTAETPVETSPVELPLPPEPVRPGMPGGSPFSPSDATDETTVR
jgi:hypothetical protein